MWTKSCGPLACYLYLQNLTSRNQEPQSLMYCHWEFYTADFVVSILHECGTEIIRLEHFLELK